MEDKDAESNVIYDGDDDQNDLAFGDDSDDEFDDWSQRGEDDDDESDGELEDSTLYNVDEILFVKQKIEQLQQTNNEQFQFMINQLDQNQQPELL